MSKLKTIFDKSHVFILLILAAFLNIFKLWDLGYGNTYYAATIKSMLTSFSNFFFVSFDSTGFITVDKPPLSLWVDAISAKIFGFNGFSILLPHAIEGVIVTFLTYKIVAKFGNKWAAIVAALAITLSPVNVAVYRNNTPDSLLLVFVLLAIFFVQKYFDKKQLKFLALSGLMIGLGFNTKMLQAFLILPAILVTLGLFIQGNLLTRIKHLAVFLVVTLIVSFSWITIVDLTPKDSRPYIGSSENNSAWNLAFGYNGSQRFEGENGVGGNPGFNVGDKGLTRLFTGEMGTQTGWLLGSALLFSLYFVIKNFKQLLKRVLGKESSITSYHIVTLVSMGFLATQYVFFSYASFFHSYYLNIFAVPVALLIGSLVYELFKSNFKDKIAAGILCISIVIQGYLIYQAQYALFLIPIILIAGLIGLGLIFVKRNLFKYAGVGVILSAVFVTPLVWSVYTTFATNTATAIFIGGPSVQGNGNRFAGGPQGFPQGMTPPNGFPQDGQGFRPMADGRQRDGSQSQGGIQTTGMNGQGGMGGGFGSQKVNSTLLSYLKDNNDNEKYFVAVESSMSASGFILDENITNVMNLGGFSGRDQAISLNDLKTKINNGEIRFFYFNQMGGGQNEMFGFDGTRNVQRDGQQNPDGQTTGGGRFNANTEISDWIKANCKAVSSISGLYDCKI